jgi:tetraacyldisaccharide 4'-kinase
VRDWWQPRLTLRTAPLLPLSWLFGLLAALRRAAFRLGLKKVQRLPVPVIVVGNLTVGGSGKTPLVIALAQALIEHGWHPGVISRGYGANAQVPREVQAASSPSEVGDEPLLIRHALPACPVFVGRDRPQAGRALLAAHPQTTVLISDDGLQHYALARDFEIAVFDARGAGNGRLLPAGPLREPLSRAGSLDAVVFNGEVSAPVGRKSWRMQLQPRSFYRLDDPAQRRLAGDFAQEAPSVAAVAGIGDPNRFFATLRSLGLSIQEHPFPDHHPYTAADLAAITAPLIVMTEKDAIKCTALRDARVWVLPVAAQLEPGLIAALLEKIRGPQTA